MMSTVDIVQTVAIIGALILTFFEFSRVREFKRVDIYSRIIEMANELRKERIQDPKLERALFQTRKNWNDLMIKKHVYAVGLANIFEWVLISRRAGLVDKRVWEEWLYVWQKVVLKDKCMAEKFTDPSVYTFSHIEAYNMVRKMVEDENYRPPDPYRGFFGR